MIYLLTSLLVCHYLADFCLTTPSMIRAKTDGSQPLPILLHASVHAFLMGICLLLFGCTWHLLLILVLMELVSHFLIDMGKGWMTARFPLFADPLCKPYWMVYGFDQLLHLLVIVFICSFSLWYNPSQP